MGSRKFAVFIDIDETLMSNGVVPKRNIDAIARIRELGHKVFLNTGRSYACIPGQILKEIRFDGVVAGIGAMCAAAMRSCEASPLRKSS